MELATFLDLINKLTAHEFVLWEYAKIQGMHTTGLKQLAHDLRMGDRSLVNRLKRLQKLDLVRYTITPKSLTFEWVARYPGETPPSEHQIRYQRSQRGTRVRSPQGKIYTVEEGKVSQFCKSHNLYYGSFIKLVNGTECVKSVKGWTLAS